MSNIPKARAVLTLIIDEQPQSRFAYRLAIIQALKLMHRKRAKFRGRNNHKPLDAPRRHRARLLRREGYSLDEIAKRLGTSIGRVSYACQKVTRRSA